MSIGAYQVRERQENLKSKVENFLNQLDSTEPEDIAINASVLSEIIQSFSLTFDVPHEKIIEMIQDSEDRDLNVEQLRRRILKLSHPNS